jgi:hypothetical protein
VAISDEMAVATGSVQSVSLIIRGTQIVDSDRDGLDDAWELNRAGSLAWDANDDPDGDGSTNAREQAVGSNPVAADVPFAVDLSWWELAGYRLPRVTWPAAPAYFYSVYGATNLAGLSLVTNLTGQFPEMEWVGPPIESKAFFRVHSTPAP